MAAASGAMASSSPDSLVVEVPSDRSSLTRESSRPPMGGASCCEEVDEARLPRGTIGVTCTTSRGWEVETAIGDWEPAAMRGDTRPLVDKATPSARWKQERHRGA